MDHMRTSGNEPSSVILAKQSSLNVENDDPMEPKQAEAKRESSPRGLSVSLSQILRIFYCFQIISF